MAGRQMPCQRGLGDTGELSVMFNAGWRIDWCAPRLSGEFPDDFCAPNASNRVLSIK